VTRDRLQLVDLLAVPRGDHLHRIALRVDRGAVGQLAPVVQPGRVGAPTSIPVVFLPVRSRTNTAGSSVDEMPSLNAIPFTYSRQYASTEVIMCASVSEAWRVTRRVRYFVGAATDVSQLHREVINQSLQRL
jgi:hypothetical protein